MNQDPEPGVLDADTEEWVPDYPTGNEPTASAPPGDDPAGRGPAGHDLAEADPEYGEPWPVPAGYEEPWPEQTVLESLPEAEEPAIGRAARRHARPRDLRRLVIPGLGLALVTAAGFAVYFWLQLGSSGEPADSADPTDAELAQAQANLAETEQALRDAQVRVVDAEARARELQDELDATITASAGSEEELQDAAEQLRAATDALADVRNQGEALASAVLGSVDPVDACARAASEVAENVDQVGRGQLARIARDAAATCAAAQDSLAPAISQARGLLAD